MEDSEDLELREDSAGNAVVCGVRVVEIDSPEKVKIICIPTHTHTYLHPQTTFKHT